ncbi:Terminal uridylyltransferase Tailor [Anthophora plagiata]
MFKKLAKNNITVCNEEFFCHLCMCVKTSFEDVSLHIDDDNHKILKNDKTDIKMQSYIKEIYQKHLYNDVTIIILYNFICIPCQRHFTCLARILQHIKSKSHIENLKNKGISYNSSQVKDMICNKSEKCKMPIEKLQFHEFKSLLKTSEVQKCDSYSNSYINDEYSKYIHFKDFVTLYNYSNKDYETLVNNRVIIYKNYQLLCKFCNHCYKTPEDILKHIDATKHAHEFKHANIKLSKSKDEEAQCIEDVNNETDKKVVQLNFTEMKCAEKGNSTELLQYLSRDTPEKQNDLKKQSVIKENVVYYVNAIISNEKGDLDLVQTQCTHESAAVVSDVTKTKEHQSNLKASKCKICFSLLCNKDRKILRTLLNNGITVDGSNKFSCTLCKRDIESLHDILQHIKGKCHKNLLKNHNEKLHISNSTNTNQSSIINFVRMDMDMNENNSTEHDINILNEKERCKTCITDDFSNLENNQIMEKDRNDITFQNCFYTCELCNKKININNLFEHINTGAHGCNIFSMSIENDIIFFKCFCCKSIIQGNRSLMKHLSSTFHLNNLTNLLMYLKTNSIETFTNVPNYVKDILEDKNFPLCDILISKVQNACIHFDEMCFICFDIKNIKCYDNIRNDICYKCLFCRATFYTVYDLVCHCQRRIHLRKIKQLLSIEEKKKEQSNASSITVLTEYISKVSINDKQTYVSDEIDDSLIVTSDVDEEIKKYLNISPLKREKKTTCNRKPLAEYLNKVYDKEYLEIEEKMYTIHEQKIDDIKLNLKLIMPYNNNNFYCIVCDKRVSKELYLLYEHVSLASHKMHVKNIEREKFEMIEQHIKKISKDLMMCFSCKNNIENVNNNVNTHINKSMHKKRTKMFNEIRDNILNSMLQILNTLWFSIERYCCVLCKINFRYKIEFLEHILEQHKGILDDRVFDFCIPCTTLWLDTEDSYTNHCDDVLHKYLMKSKDFMIDEFPNCMRKLLTQADEISDVLFKESQLLLNDSIQQEVEQSLESSFKSYFPFVKAYSFGSRVTGLAFANSDIDIYLDCEGTYYEDKRKNLEINNMIIIKEILQKHENEWDVRQILKNARIPVIKAMYKRTRIHCDISLTNSLSVENSKLIRSYNDAYLPCRKLILFIKKWFSLFNLPSGHGFKNYALTWLVIFYLQVESHLPSVAALIKTKNKSKIIWGKIFLTYGKNIYANC